VFAEVEFGNVFTKSKFFVASLARCAGVGFAEGKGSEDVIDGTASPIAASEPCQEDDRENRDQCGAHNYSS